VAAQRSRHRRRRGGPARAAPRTRAPPPADEPGPGMARPGGGVDHAGAVLGHRGGLGGPHVPPAVVAHRQLGHRLGAGSARRDASPSLLRGAAAQAARGATPSLARRAAGPGGLHLGGQVAAASPGSLATEGPIPIRLAFAPYPFLARSLGVVAALEAIRDQAADPTTDRVIEVLIVAHEKGGAIVPEILRDLAEATARDVWAAEEIDTAALEHRINARV